MLRINAKLATVLFFCVALTHPASAQTQSQKTEAVDRQLDMMEDYQSDTAETFQEVSVIKSGDIEKDFPSMQPDALQEFPGLQVDAQKEFLRNGPPDVTLNQRQN